MTEETKEQEASAVLGGLNERLVIFRICSHCNKEYKLDMYQMNGLEIRGQAYNFGDCPHCGKRNDVWIRVVI